MLARAMIKFGTKETYEQKRAAILASLDPDEERLVNGVIYCRFCHEPKMADFPERNFVTRCACVCDVKAWERKRKRDRLYAEGRVKKHRAGDDDPFGTGGAK